MFSHPCKVSPVALCHFISWSWILLSHASSETLIFPWQSLWITSWRILVILRWLIYPFYWNMIIQQGNNQTFKKTYNNVENQPRCYVAFFPGPSPWRYWIWFLHGFSFFSSYRKNILAFLFVLGIPHLITLVRGWFHPLSFLIWLFFFFLRNCVVSNQRIMSRCQWTLIWIYEAFHCGWEIQEDHHLWWYRRVFPG